jgi:hypothetical protein
MRRKTKSKSGEKWEEDSRLSQPNNPPRRSYRFLKTNKKQGYFFCCKEKRSRRERDRRKRWRWAAMELSTSAKELQRMRGAREEEEERL